MGAVLISVGAIDLIQYRRAGGRERNALLEAARGDANLAGDRGDATPTDDPGGLRSARRPVAADRGGLDLLDCA